MSLESIQAVLLDILREVQTLSGHEWADLDQDAKPIGQLESFDSLLAIEATVMVEERLGCGDLGVGTIFVSDDGKRALTMKEIELRINKLLAEKGGKA